MKDKSSAGVQWFICDAGHVHLTFMDENDNPLFSTSMDVEFWCDLADEIDSEIEEIIDASEEAEFETKH
jgi:hypothetical protein